MADHKVHASTKYVGGVQHTLCGRKNPLHSTVSWDWVTCKVCHRIGVGECVDRHLRAGK